MSSERSKITDKAKKLRELANRGIDGEKETAKRMYDSYKKKHKLTDEEVDGHEYTDEFIKEFSKMSDQELLEFIGKSLIVLGVGLIFSLVFEKTDVKSRSKMAKDLKNTFKEFNSRKNKKEQHENEEESKPSSTEILLGLNDILDNNIDNKEIDKKND